jgi:hypothetical protein
MFAARLVMATALIFAALRAFAGAPAPGTSFDHNWGVVFPDAKALELVRQCSRASPGPVQGTWTPTAQQIEELDNALFPALTVQFVQRELADKGFQASDYYRQYGGLIVGRQRIIYVNGFHRHVVEQSPRAASWKTAAVGICDGGELAFGAEYDPESKSLEKFQFNGRV